MRILYDTVIYNAWLGYNKVRYKVSVIIKING